jgi:hypothetical protein
MLIPKVIMTIKHGLHPSQIHIGQPKSLKNLRKKLRLVCATLTSRNIRECSYKMSKYTVLLPRGTGELKDRKKELKVDNTLSAMFTDSRFNFTLKVENLIPFHAVVI